MSGATPRPDRRPPARGDVGSELDRSVGGFRTGASPPPRSAADIPSDLDLSVGALRTGPAGAAADEAACGLRPGTLLKDRYEIRALLGAGGMGAVYRAHDRERGADVALKVMLPSLLAREKAAERFRHEAEVMLRLAHQGIVRVFDVGEDRAIGVRFFTMELLEGMSLREWLEEKKRAGEAVDPAEALEVVRQILDALRYAHQTTVHRDLKPENVFLVADPHAPADAAPRAKVLDFGIAKLQSASQFTSTSMALGTAYYMAPEQQLDAAKVDRRADLYSVCVILYEMLTGKLPVGRFNTPAEERRSLPRALDAVILRGLAPEPEKRPETAERLLAELGTIRALVERGAGGRGGRGLRIGIAAAVVAIVTAVPGVYLGFIRPRAAERERGPGDGPAAAAAPLPAPASPAAAPAPPPAPAPLPAVRFADLEPADGAPTRETAIVVRGRVEGEGVVTVAAVVANRVPLDVRDGRFEGKIPAAPSIELVAQAADGRALARERRSVVVDRDPPVLRVDGGEAHLTRHATYVLAGDVLDANPEPRIALDDVLHPVESGRFAIECRVDAGEKRVTLKSRDRAGNETAATVRIVRDVEPPRLTVGSPARVTLTRAGAIEVSGAVEDAHPALVFVGSTRLDVVAGGRFRLDVPLAEGANLVPLVAVDGASNLGGAAILVVTCDTRPSAISLAGLPERATRHRFAVAGTVDEDGCAVTVNGAPARVTGRGFAADLILDRGENAIEVAATDPAGNEARATATVVCEAQALEVLEPADGLVTNAEEIVVRGRVDPDAVARVRVGEVAVEPRDGRFEARVKAAESIEVVAEAKDGKRLAVETRKVVIDREAPAIYAPDRRIVRDPKVTIEGAVEDKNPSPDILVDGRPLRLEKGRFKIEREVTEKDVTVKLVARDLAGNESSKDVVIARDVTPPSIEIEFSDGEDEVLTWGAQARIPLKWRDAHYGQVLVDGKPLEWRVPATYEGQEVTLVPVDEAGNRGAPTKVTVRRRKRDADGLLGSKAGRFRLEPPDGWTVSWDEHEQGWYVIATFQHPKDRTTLFAVRCYRYYYPRTLSDGAVESYSSADDFTRQVGEYIYGDEKWTQGGVVEKPHPVLVGGDIRATRIAWSFGKARKFANTRIAELFPEGAFPGEHVFVVAASGHGFYVFNHVAPPGRLGDYEDEFEEMLASFEELFEEK